MTPYYDQDGITVYHGDCREVLPTLAPESVSLLLTDPPYFNVKDEDWDRQWKQASAFLDWLGGVLDDAKPSLLPSASAWVFASPQLATSVERVVGQRFRVLNSVRWVKEQGWHQKAEIEAQRRFLTPWEAVVFAEQTRDLYEDAAREMHKATYAPLGDYIAGERERAGLTRSDLEVALGYVSRTDPTRGSALCYRWEEGSSLPTADAYKRMRAVLNGGRGFGEFLPREYDDLVRESAALREKFEADRVGIEHLRRPFKLNAAAPVSDVWNFGTVAPYPGKHPCEKPLPMLRHMLGVSSRPGDVVLDCFAGSGSTLLAARDMGRRAIGIEQDERWCEFTAARLSQGALFDVDGAA